MVDNVVWRPQSKPQLDLIECPLPEVFFGGARGGGKTDGVLGKWAIKEQIYGEHFNAIMFRRTTVSSTDAIERSKALYKPLGGQFNESKLIWRMPNGGHVAFAYLDSVSDADEYQGRNLTDAWIEEAGQYPDSSPIDKLFGVLRSAAGVPVQMILTANPGGAGQHWIAERYGLIPFPARTKIVRKELANGSVHKIAVIPSRITDNRVLLDSDPGYIDRLHLVGSAALVRAWLDGDWSAVEGAFFDKWSPRNVVSPFDIPRDWARFRSADWGFAKPFSIGWWAVCADTKFVSPSVDAGSSQQISRALEIPRGAIVRYREWYGCPGKPNVGLRLTAEEVAQGILTREAGESNMHGVLDPAAFAQDGGPSIAERMAKLGVYFRPADNKRVGQRGMMGGWDMMRARIAGQDGIPMLYVFDTCKDFLRTVPVMQHDPDRAEDLDTESEDHVADECFVAGTMVETVDGPRAIESLPQEGYVVTDVGLRKYEKPRLTRRNAEVVRVTFADGKVVECTPNHQFMVGSPDEWEYAENLEGLEVTCARQSLVTLCRSSTASVTTAAAIIFSAEAFVSIVQYGRRQTGQFLKVATSTIKTVIELITRLITSNVFLPQSILASATGKHRLSAACLRLDTLAKPPGNGTGQKLEGSGTASITPEQSCPSWQSAFLRSVRNAVLNTWLLRSGSGKGNTAIRTAKRVRCVSVKRLQKRADVYCISVPGVERFAIEGGLMVHNCRYACMSRPWLPSKSEPQANKDRSGYRSYDDEDDGMSIKVL